jgi:hypothetical protein
MDGMANRGVGKRCVCVRVRCVARPRMNGKDGGRGMMTDGRLRWRKALGSLGGGGVWDGRRVKEGWVGGGRRMVDEGRGG